MLDQILAAKRKRLTEQKKKLPFQILKDRVSLSPATRNFRQALLGENVSIIAEIKKASPSLGDIALDIDVKKTALLYEGAGAAAISVLTEEDYFKGNSDFIKVVKGSVKLPILRKDFIFKPYQVYESRYLGADALLLIASILEEKTLKDLVQLSYFLNLEPLVEVHTEEDLAKALKTKAKVIGVNNRDLNSFKTDIDTTKRLIPLMGLDKIVVSESGIKDAKDVKMLKNLGVDAILVGESIIKSGDYMKKIKELLGDCHAPPILKRGKNGRGSQ